jgi:undecaprenyl-diphosphatase
MPENAPDIVPLPPIEQHPTPEPRVGASIVVALVAAVLSVLLFSWLAHFVFDGAARQFDERVRGAVHGMASPLMTRAMINISSLGATWLVIIFVVALGSFAWLRWRRAALWLLLSFIGALVLDVVLKYTFHRARPVPFFGVAPRSYSFPSGHAFMSFCLYGVLAGLITARIRSVPIRVCIWIFAALLVFAIGLSRIYLGVHYPTDVIAGYIGAAVWVSSLVVADRFRRRRRA